MADLDIDDIKKKKVNVSIEGNLLPNVIVIAGLLGSFNILNKCCKKNSFIGTLLIANIFL